MHPGSQPCQGATFAAVLGGAQKLLLERSSGNWCAALACFRK